MVAMSGILNNVSLLLGVAASILALASFGVQLWRWRRTSRRIETPDRDSLHELKQRRAAVLTARADFPSRMAYQVHVSFFFASASAIFVPAVGAITIILIAQFRFGGPLAVAAGIMAWLCAFLFLWVAHVLSKRAEHRRLVAEDFDHLERIERRIAAIEENPLR